MKKSILLLVFLISGFGLKANFLSGYITFKSQGGFNWRITTYLISDTLSGPNPASISIAHRITGGSTIGVYTLTKFSETAIQNGMVEVLYQTDIVFNVDSIPTGDTHFFIMNECCRGKLANATDDEVMVLQSTTRAMGSSESLQMATRVEHLPPMVVEKGQPMNYTFNFFDQDADSFTYFADTVMGVLVATGGVDPGWFTPPGMTFDTDSREIAWTPSDTGNYVFRIQVLEWSTLSGNLIGSVIYEMLIKVVDIPGNNQPEFLNTGTWPVNADGKYEFTAYAGTPFTLVVEAQDEDGDALSAISSGGENNSTTTNTATFTPVIINDSTIQGTFEWLPDSLDFRDDPYEMSFRVFEEKPPYTLNADISILLKTSLDVSRTADRSMAGNNILVYPNPVSELISVKLALSESQKLKMELLDNQGRIIKVMDTRVIQKGDVVLMKEMDGLTSGLYFLNIVGDKGFKGKELILVQ